MSYARRLSSICAARGRLCVGIDPMGSVLTAWGVDHSPRGLERCARGIVEELGETVAVFKPQSAFFEVFGSEGIAILERVLSDIREAGALSILDVKRGDIGSSMAGYASAYLDDDSSLRADAITVNPFLGPDSLLSTFDHAARNNRGIYVLARTSNPESSHIQLAQTNGSNISQMIVDHAQRANPDLDDAVGLVVGATHADVGCDLSAFTGSILAPGIGAQGAAIEDLEHIFGSALEHVLPTTSRAVIGFGPGDLTDRVAPLLHDSRRLWC